MNLYCLQHVLFENSGTISVWAAANKHTINYIYLFETNFLLPQLHEFDALLIMGGYMNVDDEERFPWLNEEKKFIRQAIDAGKKVIGICLGSQLIAKALGSKVYQGKEKEIGFFPITFTKEGTLHQYFNHFSNPYTVFHWHSDTFDLPANAQLIASTDSCRHQAYIIGTTVLAFQFHFEMNETVIEDMLLHDEHELEQTAKYIQSKEEIRKQFHHLQQNKKDLFLILDKFFAA